MPYVIREIVSDMDLNTAAIFYDSTICKYKKLYCLLFAYIFNHIYIVDMENKYWKLLLNLHTRHVIRKLPEDNDINDNLQQLRKLDFNSFFIMANSSKIEQVLNKTDCIYFKRNFLWVLVTLSPKDNNTIFLEMPKCNQTEDICRNNEKVNVNVCFVNGKQNWAFET